MVVTPPRHPLTSPDNIQIQVAEPELRTFLSWTRSCWSAHCSSTTTQAASRDTAAPWRVWTTPAPSPAPWAPPGRTGRPTPPAASQLRSGPAWRSLVTRRGLAPPRLAAVWADRARKVSAMPSVVSRQRYEASRHSSVLSSWLWNVQRPDLYVTSCDPSAGTFS